MMEHYFFSERFCNLVNFNSNFMFVYIVQWPIEWVVGKYTPLHLIMLQKLMNKQRNYQTFFLKHTVFIWVILVFEKYVFFSFKGFILGWVCMLDFFQRHNLVWQVWFGILSQNICLNQLVRFGISPQELKVCLAKTSALLPG